MLDDRERCDICNRHIDEVGELLDDVCAQCNPESHEAEAELEAEQLEQELWGE